MEYHDCPLIILFENKNDKNEPEHQIELPNQIDKEVFDPIFNQAYDQNQYDRYTYHKDQENPKTFFDNLPEHQVELQTQMDKDFLDPSYNQTYHQIQYERSTYHNNQEDIICNEDQTNKKNETSELNDNRVANKDGRFLCSICNETYSTKGNLKKHEKKFCKSGSIENNSEDQKRVAKKYERFVCSICDQTFSTKGNLKKHEKKFCKSGSIEMKRVEIKGGPLLCSSCNKTFSSKTNLNKHQKKIVSVNLLK